MVSKLRSREVFVGEYCHACRRTNTSSSHTKMAVQRSFFLSFYGSVPIDSWDETKEDEET